MLPVWVVPLPVIENQTRHSVKDEYHLDVWSFAGISCALLYFVVQSPEMDAPYVFEK